MLSTNGKTKNSKVIVIRKVFLEEVTEHEDENQADAKSQLNLTAREKEVLKYIVEGDSNIQIAEKLFISVHTAKAHVANIMQKMGVNDRVCVAVCAVRENLV